MTGKELRAMRQVAGLMAVELAAKLSVSQSAVTRWEDGTRPILPRTEIAIRSVLAGMALPTKRGRKGEAE